MAWGIAKGGRGVPKFKRRYVKKQRRKMNQQLRTAIKLDELEYTELDSRHRHSAAWDWL